ncbi:recombinase family protein [Blautia sp.]|uniref:recombinase family protein n=1 Tax=Blautia sp. TaxID=1955243 RepID=UPI0035227D35
MAREIYSEYQVQFQRFDTIKKKHWSPTTVSAIVRDEIYIGTRIWGKNTLQYAYGP